MVKQHVWRYAHLYYLHRFVQHQLSCLSAIRSAGSGQASLLLLPRHAMLLPAHAGAWRKQVGEHGRLYRLCVFVLQRHNNRCWPRYQDAHHRLPARSVSRFISHLQGEMACGRCAVGHLLIAHFHQQSLPGHLLFPHHVRQLCSSNALQRYQRR